MEEVRERIFDHRGFLVLPEVGEPAPMQTQGCCVLNQTFLLPIIKAMKAAKTLKLPSLEQIHRQLVILWTTHQSAKKKKKGSSKGRLPKLDDSFQLEPEILAHALTDAKGIKSLLSFVRKQFLSERVPKDSRLN